MSRGDVVIVPVRGDFGKTRPCVGVQSNRYDRDFGTIVVCPLSTDLEATHILWVEVEATPANGLHQKSVAMTDKIVAVISGRIRQRVGAVDQHTMRQIDIALASLLELNQVLR